MLKKRIITLAVVLISSLGLAEPVIHKVAVRENLEFLEPGRTERMDLYYPADPQPGEKFPGIVIIHGGGWTGGIRNAEREVNIGSNLARMGYVSISIDYRLATPGNVKKYGKTFPVNIQDCKKAVQWLRKHAEELKLDPAKIGTIGGSAGGHLATLTAVAGPEAGLEPTAPYPGIDTSVQACVNLYGVMDFAGFKSGRTAVKKSRERVMGCPPSTANQKVWQSASPIHQVDPKDPPILQIHAKADTTVGYNQAVIMKEELDRQKVYNELILLDGYGHMFSLQKWRGKPLPELVRQRVLAFYDRFLKGLSATESAERFAALESFEKNHPEAANYGISAVSSGKIEKANVKEMTVSLPDGGKKVYKAAFDMKLEKAEPAELSQLKDQLPVVVQGDFSGKDPVKCSRIILAGRNRARIPGRAGILRKDADGWALALTAGKKVTLRKLIISEQTKLFTCAPAKMKDLAGFQVITLQARDYGDCRKIYYGLFFK